MVLAAVADFVVLAQQRISLSTGPHHPCLGPGRVVPYSAARGQESVTRDALDDLKRQIPILDYLHAHDWRPVRQLSRGRWMGLCPLHQDHHPSFVVDPGKGLFYCYGCGRGGDVIRFAEIYHEVRFPQAVALLRQWRGLAPLLQDAANFYRLQLHRHWAAFAYLDQRGIRSPEVIDHMRIGYAPGACLRGWLWNWATLYRRCLRRAWLRPRATTRMCIASFSRWTAISMGAASQLRRRLTGFCLGVKVACTAGTKFGGIRK